MSQENVEIVQRGIEAFNRRDVDLLAELTTPDFAWFPALPGAVEADGYRGRAGMETARCDLAGTAYDQGGSWGCTVVAPGQSRLG